MKRFIIIGSILFIGIIGGIITSEIVRLKRAESQSDKLNQAMIDDMQENQDRRLKDIFDGHK